MQIILKILTLVTKKQIQSHKEVVKEQVRSQPSVPKPMGRSEMSLGREQGAENDDLPCLRFILRKG